MIKDLNPTFFDRSNLIGEWLGDGDYKDTSGSSNDGTVTNVSFGSSNRGYTGEVGSFNGTNASMDTNLVVSGTTISINFFYKHTIAGTDDEIFSQGYKASLAGRLGLQVKTDNTLFLFQIASPNALITSPTALVVGETYMITVTKNSNVWELFIDNISQGTSSDGISLPNESLLFMQLATSNFQAGQLGLIRVFDSIISNTERNILKLEGLRKFGPKNLIGNNGAFQRYSLANLEQGKTLEISRPNIAGTYHDQTGSLNNGTNNGATDNVLGVNNRMNFDGIGDYMLKSSGLPTSLTSYTVALTVRNNGLINGETITSLYKRLDGFRLIVLEQSSGIIQAGHRNSAGSIQMFDVGGISTTGFTRIIWTWDGSNIRIYNNGALVSTNLVTSIQTIVTGNFIIGGSDNAPSTPIGAFSPCDVLDYNFYANKVLTDTEAQQDFYSNKII